MRTYPQKHVCVNNYYYFYIYFFKVNHSKRKELRQRNSNCKTTSGPNYHGNDGFEFLGNFLSPILKLQTFN